MKLTVHPSPALIARADETIGDCIRKMRTRGVGSVLVVKANDRNELIGIFTERDLLIHVDQIQHGGYWDRSISSVMTRPVKTLELKDIDKAPEMMLKHGFRHLPVVLKQGSSKPQILGVISMRDLLHSLLHSPKDAPVTQEFRVGMVSKNPSFSQPLSRGLDALGPLSVEQITVQTLGSPEKLSIKINSLDALILDIDQIEPKEWAEALRWLNLRRKAPLVIIVYDPALQPDRIRTLLGRLAQSGKMEAFEKPLDLFRLFQRLR